MAPEFEIFWKIEIVRMISFSLPDLRLSAIGAPELRIAAPEAWGMTLTQKSRMCRAPELRIVNPCVWFRCIFEDCIQLEKDQAWLEGDQAQAHPETRYPT